MIKYNPLYKANGQPNGALVIAPSESIVFDLPGKATWVKGVKLKGTDHTYTFSHDNYITLTNTPDLSNPESEDIKIGVNITNLLTEFDKVRIYIGENNNTAESALTTNPYIKLFYNDVRKQTFLIKSANDTNLTVTTDANGNIIIENKKPDINHNTDYRVSQLLATSSEDFRILFKGTADDNPETTSTKFSGTLLYNPNTKVLKVNSNVVIHEGLVLDKSATIGNTLTTIASIGNIDIKAKIDDSALLEQLSLILANLNSQINSINTKILNFEELNTQVLNINGSNYNIYTSNPSLPTIVAPDSLGTAKLLLSVNTTGDGFAWIDDSIINTNIDVAWNTETTIATIHGIPIKIKIPTNPNTWRNVRINNSDEDVLTSNDPIPLVISQGNGIEVAYANNKLIITNTAPDVDHNTHYTTALYAGDNNDTTSNSSITNPYIKLFDDSVRRSTLQLKGGNGIRVESNSGIITITNDSIEDLCRILATLKGEIHNDIYQGINTVSVNSETIGTNYLYADNVLINSFLAAHSGNIVTQLTTLSNWNTEYTIAQIAGVDIKIKTPINPISELSTKNLKLNGIDYALYTTETSLPTFFAPLSLGNDGEILSTNGSEFTWITKPTSNVTTSAVLSDSNSGTSHISSSLNNPYYNLIEGSSVTRSIRFLAGDGISILASTNGEITILNTKPDINHNTNEVSLTKVTDDKNYRILFKTSNNDIDEIGGTNYASTLVYNPDSKELKVDGNIVLHSGNYLNYTDEISKILNELKGEIHNLIPDNQLINADILSSVDLYSDNIWENGIKLTDKYLNILGSNGSITTTNNLLNNLTEVTTVNDSSYTIISGWNKVGLPNIYNYIFTKWVNDNPDLVAIEAIGNTEGFLRKLDENTWYLDNSIPETFENLCKILANLQSSISSINSKLLEFNTESLGINDAYIQKLIVEGNANIQGAVTGGSFIKAGGTSVLFLKADGSVDSTNYLPLTGGVLSGSITAPRFITTGGTADYFVKGDGTLDNTTYINETTWNEYQENISIILNSIHGSIKNFRDILDTSSFGINNAYIENLIVSNTASFTNRPIIGNSEVLINTDKMYIGTTQVSLTRTSSPLDLYNVHLISGGTTVSDALLSNGSQSSVWLYWDAINGLSSPWGIMAKNSSSTIEFIKAGSTYITLNLSNGSITSNAFVKQGGTSSLFLKADGSVDSTKYINETTYNADQLNLCLVLNSLKGSIKNIREILDTNSFGINNAYIENLIAVNGSFTATPSVNGTLVSLDGHTHDDRYFTETESNNRFVLKAGDTMTGNLTVPSLFVNTGDSTLKIYSGKQTDGTSDGHIGLQTCIDGQDGLTHSYASQYQAREVLALQPRGGQVYIGTMPNGGVTTYKLYVNGNIFASSFVKDGGTSSQFLKANGSVDSTEYLPKNTYNADQLNLCLILNTLQGSITSAHAKIKNLDFSNILQLGAVNAYFDEAVISGTLYAANNTFRADASGAYYSSDIRKKENICLLNDEDYNKIINSPDGYLKQFTWKENGNLSFGLIAQEVQEFAPEAVTQIGDYYSVNYNVALSKLLAALYRKVKELELIINELKMKFEL